jgi:hypothetical protein
MVFHEHLQSRAPTVGAEKPNGETGSIFVTFLRFDRVADFLSASSSFLQNVYQIANLPHCATGNGRGKYVFRYAK